MTEVRGRVELAARELHLLQLLAGGADNRQAAGQLQVSERTVKALVHDMCLRTHTNNRAHLVAFALRRGLIT
jgi:DNA-binding CsgD family transcriptional regulator